MELNDIVLCLVAFAPGVLWLVYFYKKDYIEPEPRWYVFLTFVLGMLAAAICYFCGDVARGTVSETTYRVLIAPILEESVKLAFVFFGMYRHSEFDEPMDGIVYAATCAMGFAAIENALYVHRFSDENFVYGFVIRALLSVPGHALFASMWGYALGLAKFAKRPRRKGIILKGLLLGIFLHALWNVIVLAGEYAQIILLILSIIMWVMVHKNIDAALKDSPHMNHEEDEDKNNW